MTVANRSSNEPNRQPSGLETQGMTPGPGGESGEVGSRRRNPELVYLYCVVESGTDANQMLTDRRVPGLIEDEPLFPIEVAGLVAVVSRVPAATFDEAPLNALLADLERLTPFAVRHEEAIRSLLPVAPSLVPMAFGGVYRGPERVAHFLREQAAELHRLLDRLRGRQEWGLKVFRDPARALAAAEAASAELQRLLEEATKASPGRAYLLTRQRDRLRATEAERLTAQALDDIRNRLLARSVAVHQEAIVAPAPPVASPTPGGPSGLLVFRAAFLVEAATVPDFQADVAELSRSYAPWGLQVEVNGPWAPYSFIRTKAEAVRIE